ncbi:MAG: hypothetical protein F9K25_14885 [Candidatus Contendobacter sp.]|nr:MAG: hypothetical protein F9K25_14885 [Candidatus Contendobacter sp.]
MLMPDDRVAGAAVDEPLLLILLGERAAAARLEAEWRREARAGLQALVQREPMAEPADLLALAGRLGVKFENGSATGPFERDRRVS